jgi:hypothetical protein
MHGDDVPDRDAVLEAVAAALQDVVDNEQDLLSLGAHELALVHRFGVYLERHLDDELKRHGLTIDLDYDRHGRLRKFLPPKRDRTGQGRFRPDLIIHHRKDDEKNLLVLEWKKNLKPKTRERLRERVAELLSDDAGHEGYAYRNGVLVDSRADIVKWCEVDREGALLLWNIIAVPASDP